MNLLEITVFRSDAINYRHCNIISRPRESISDFPVITERYAIACSIHRNRCYLSAGTQLIVITPHRSRRDIVNIHRHLFHVEQTYPYLHIFSWGSNLWRMYLHTLLSHLIELLPKTVLTPISRTCLNKRCNDIIHLTIVIVTITWHCQQYIASIFCCRLSVGIQIRIIKLHIERLAQSVVRIVVLVHNVGPQKLKTLKPCVYIGGRPALCIA